MKKLLVLLVLISCTVEAEIYRSQNEKGEWTFSDRPSANAKQLKLPPLSTYTPVATPSVSPAGQQDAPPNSYKSMVFIEPENNLTIRDLDSRVTASVKLDPQLNTRRGDKIQFYLNEEPHGDPAVTATLTLKNLERGTYVVGASVLDAEGKTLFSASPVIFHVHRISLNNPARKRAPPPKAK